MPDGETWAIFFGGLLMMTAFVGALAWLDRCYPPPPEEVLPILQFLATATDDIMADDLPPRLTRSADLAGLARLVSLGLGRWRRPCRLTPKGWAYLAAHADH